MPKTIIADSSYLQGYRWAETHPTKVCPHVKDYQQAAQTAPKHIADFNAGVLAWFDDYTQTFIKGVRTL